MTNLLEEAITRIEYSFRLSRGCNSGFAHSEAGAALQQALLWLKMKASDSARAVPEELINEVLEVAEHLQVDNGKLTATEQYDLGEQLYTAANNYGIPFIKVRGKLK